jgi:hypothetical protein
VEAAGPVAALAAHQPALLLSLAESYYVMNPGEDTDMLGHPFTCGHTSAFHTATASSSRSSAWRTGTWQDQPCRRISFYTPSGV